MNYLHPRVSSRIIDLIEYSYVTTNLETSFFIPFFSERGEDNVIKEWTNWGAFQQENGSVNFKKQGQAIFNIREVLNNGGKVYGLRVTPPVMVENPNLKPATISNCFLDIQTKFEAGLDEDLIENLGSVSAITVDNTDVKSTKFIGGDLNSVLTEADKARIRINDEVIFKKETFVAGSFAEETNDSVVHLNTVYLVTGINLDVDGLVNNSKIYFVQKGALAELTVKTDALAISSSNFTCLFDDTLLTTGTYKIYNNSSLSELNLIGSAEIEIVDNISIKAALLDGMTIDAAGDNRVKIDFGSWNLVSIAQGADITIDRVTALLLDGTIETYFTVTGLYPASPFTAIGNISYSTDGGVNYSYKGMVNFEFDSTLGTGNINISPVQEYIRRNLSDVTYGTEVDLSAFGLETKPIVGPKTISKDGFFVINLDGAEHEYTLDEESLLVVVKTPIVETGYIDNDPDPDDFFIKTGKVDYTDATIADISLFINAVNAKVNIRPVSISKNATLFTDLETFIESPNSDPRVRTTEDGFKRHIIFGLSAKGRSEYYNDFSFTLTPNSAYDEDLSKRRAYNLVVQQNIEGTIMTYGPFLISFDKFAITGLGQKIWAPKVLGENMERFNSYYNEDAYNDLLEDLSEANNKATTPGDPEYVSTALPVDPLVYDFLNATERSLRDPEDPNEQKWIEIVNDTITRLSIANDSYVQRLFTVKTVENVDGINFINYENIGYFRLGSIGSLDGYDKNGVKLSNLELKNLKDTLKEMAYSGRITEDIYNKKKYPFDVVLDANDSILVKKAMVAFVEDEQRQDIFAFLDTGIGTSYLSALNTRNSDLGTINSFRTAIFTQDFKITDEYTSDIIKVSPTYFLASKIPYNDNTFGRHISFVGKRRGVLRGFIKDGISFLPNDRQQTELYKVELNYAIESNDIIYWNGQLTSQIKKSPLSEIPNVRTLLLMIRRCENRAEEFKFEKVTSYTDLEAALDNEVLEFKQKSAVRDISFKVSATPEERAAKIARVRVEVSFYEFIETILFDWIIQK